MKTNFFKTMLAIAFLLPVLVSCGKDDDNGDISGNEVSVVINGVNGWMFTDKSTGNSIFLPATGLIVITGNLEDVGTSGYCWSSTPESGSSAYILEFYIDKNVVEWSDEGLTGGVTVRPVAE